MIKDENFSISMDMEGGQYWSGSAHRILGWCKLKPKKDYELNFRAIKSDTSYPATIIRSSVFDIKKEKDVHIDNYVIYNHLDSIWQVLALYRFLSRLEVDLGEDFKIDKLALIEVLANIYTKDETLRINQDRTTGQYYYSFVTSGVRFSDETYGYVGKNHYARIRSENFCIDIKANEHNNDKLLRKHPLHIVAKFYGVQYLNNVLVKDEKPFLTLEKTNRFGGFTSDELEFYMLFSYFNMMQKFVSSFSKPFDIVEEVYNEEEAFEKNPYFY